MDLVVAAYRLSDTFPRDERFGLTSQLRRAAISIPANIAEGQSRPTRKGFMRFLAMARPSLREADTHVLIAVRVGYVTADSARGLPALSDEVGRMLTALHATLARGGREETRHSSPVTQQTARKNSSQSRIP